MSRRRLHQRQRGNGRASFWTYSTRFGFVWSKGPSTDRAHVEYLASVAGGELLQCDAKGRPLRWGR